MCLHLRDTLKHSQIQCPELAQSKWAGEMGKTEHELLCMETGWYMPACSFCPIKT